jgi:uncharacterized glyoxalase superfamily protein PhnB
MSETQEAQLGPVMMFTAKRAEVVRFYREVAGLAPEDSGDATWLDLGNAKLAVHDPSDRETPAEVRSQTSFVVWLGVHDVRASFERAARAGVTIGEFNGDFFFARDPDGRFVGFYPLEDAHGHDHAH